MTSILEMDRQQSRIVESEDDLLGEIEEHLRWHARKNAGSGGWPRDTEAGYRRAYEEAAFLGDALFRIEEGRDVAAREFFMNTHRTIWAAVTRAVSRGLRPVLTRDTLKAQLDDRVRRGDLPKEDAAEIFADPAFHLEEQREKGPVSAVFDALWPRWRDIDSDYSHAPYPYKWAAELWLAARQGLFGHAAATKDDDDQERGLADRLADVLHTEGRPMTSREMAGRLSASENIVRARLGEDRKFVRRGRTGHATLWALA